MMKLSGLVFAMMCLNSTALKLPIQTQGVSSHSISSVRRDLFAKAALMLPLALPKEAGAAVFYDPDVYGDKELKIAILNRSRQLVSNAITASPDLAIGYVLAFLTETLTYDAASGNGGCDGATITALAAAKSKTGTLGAAVDSLNGIQSQLKRTTEISVGDVSTLALTGAVEAFGNDRIREQIGKVPVKYNADIGDVAWSEGDFFKVNVIDKFKKAGLGEREVAIVAGVVGDMRMILDAYKKKDNSMGAYDDDYNDNEMGDVEFIPPTSFGAPKEIFGGVKFDRKVSNVYLQSILGKKAGTYKPNGSVWDDDTVRGWGSKYAQGKGANFEKDIIECFEILGKVGQQYTGGKVEALLGQ